MSEVHVLAIISTKPGLRDTVLDLFRDNAEKVRAEDGCIQYEAGIDCDEELSFQTEFGSDTFVVIEKWDSTESLKSHLISPHMKEYSSMTKEHITSRTIHVLSRLRT